MSRIRRLESHEVVPELRGLFDKSFALRGNVPNTFRVLAHRPDIFATLLAHVDAVVSGGCVERRIKELVIVRTSQMNGSPSSVASHTAIARNLGWAASQLKDLANWEAHAEFTAAEKAALALAEVVTEDPHDLSDEQFGSLSQHFSAEQIVELVATIGLFNYLNRFNIALGVEPTRDGEGGPA